MQSKETSGRQITFVTSVDINLLKFTNVANYSIYFSIVDCDEPWYNSDSGFVHRYYIHFKVVLELYPNYRTYTVYWLSYKNKSCNKSCNKTKTQVCLNINNTQFYLCYNKSLVGFPPMISLCSVLHSFSWTELSSIP